ncbi:MAG: pyridoxal-phosphate dependent enzyme [Ferruginibacter sp.]
MTKDFGNIECTEIAWPPFAQKGISLFMARLDKIHPVISGNKLYKLYYFIKETIETEHKTILTFGGPYSNHLVATAYACRQNNLTSIGIVRGKNPVQLSATLLDCVQYGMELIFASRKEYKDDAFLKKISSVKNGQFTLVPEGGFSQTGAKGAALIVASFQHLHPTHICTAVGTATTLAGIINNIFPEQQLIAVPALKNMVDIPERIYTLTGKNNFDNLTVLGDYHFGGYAKKNNELLDFMNNFFSATSVPLDFVYTAKMMYALIKNIENNYFAPGSRIVCLHTGGLQGNRSLLKGTLNYG